MRKSLFIPALISVVLFQTPVVAHSAELELLSHQEFVNLPADKQAEYVIAIRESLAGFPGVADEVALLDVSPFSFFIERAEATPPESSSDVADQLTRFTSEMKTYSTGRQTRSADEKTLLGFYATRQSLETKILKLPAAEQRKLAPQLKELDAPFSFVNGIVETTRLTNPAFKQQQAAHETAIAQIQGRAPIVKSANATALEAQITALREKTSGLLQTSYAPGLLDAYDQRDAIEKAVAASPKADQAALLPALKTLDSGFVQIAKALKSESSKPDAIVSAAAVAEAGKKNANHDERRAQFEKVSAQAEKSVAQDADVDEPIRDKACVRCIYSGFLIRGQSRCRPVKTGGQLQTAMGDFSWPPPWKPSDFICAKPSQVMCNPLVYGIKNDKALCVNPSKSATRDCSAAASTEDKPMAFTVKLITGNPKAYERFKDGLKKVCGDKSYCSSKTNRDDIAATCSAMIDRMNVLAKHLGDHRDDISRAYRDQYKRSKSAK